MNISKLLFLLFFFSCLFSCSDSDINDNELSPEPEITAEQQIIIDAISADAHVFNPSPLLVPDSELSFLDEIGDSRIIGLGEATHGTKEFFQMKHRIFQYLVENQGFTAFVFEIDLAESRIFNDWVQHRVDGNVENLMRNRMYFWTWRTSEVWDLLNWMRTYNEGKAEEDMIGFYGVDSQISFYNRDALIQIINKVDSEKGRVISEKTQEYANIRTLYQDSLNDVLVARIRNDLEYIKEEVESLLPQIESNLGSKEALWAERLIRNMQQVELVTYDGARNGRYYQRDLFMAENTSWYFDLLGDDAKLVLWAHNAHLADNYQFGGPWGGSQGHYLKETYGDDYQIIGFSFARGSFTAVTQSGPLQTQYIGQEPETGSLNWFFSKTGFDHFVIKTTSSDESLDNWFKSSPEFMMMGAVFNGNPLDYYYEIPVQIHYDFIIHLDRTSNSILL